MKLHTAAILVIVISLISLSATVFINDFGSHYSKSADFGDLNDTFDSINKVNTEMNEIKKNLTAIELDTVGDFIYIPYAMIKIGWKSVKSMFFSWTIVTSFIGDMSDASPFKLPTWATASIVGIIIISLVSMLLYLFFKWKVEN